MLETVEATKPDPILALMQQYRQDNRADKIDLGVGVYKDSQGQTPIMRAVKMAEKQLYDEESTKTYVSPTGDLEFCAAVEKLVFNESVPTERVRGIQTPGGSGALRVLADLLKAASPDAKIWVSDPTWPNHLPMLTQAGHTIERYPYYNAERCEVDFEAMMQSLNQAAKGDIVLLHGCCHNPTGADLSSDQWQAVADLCREKNLFPFVDMAYQGFGDGLDEDASSVRLLASQLPEMVIATSCSKNLALYRERTGCALVVAENEQAASNSASKAVALIRANYSMPPDHGASMTRIIMQNPKLFNEWKEELESMRTRMQRLRDEFATALRKRSNSDRFDYISGQKGMFSRLPLTEPQVDRLREEFGIYMVGDGRFNVAGLPDQSNEVMDRLAENIVRVMGEG